MTQTTVVELDCDNEPCWSGPYRSTTADPDEARRQAQRYGGWTYDFKTNNDFCRKCSIIKISED